MKTALNKNPHSFKTIRFQDCDPFGHLNNSKYLDYMINVREDHLIEEYGLNIFKMAQRDKKSWVVGHTEIAYFKSAQVMEEVMIRTRLIEFSDRHVKAEMVMTNKEESHVKAVLWSKFYYFDFVANKGTRHTPELMARFEDLVVPLEVQNAELRAKLLNKSLKERHEKMAAYSIDS